MPNTEATLKAIATTKPVAVTGVAKPKTFKLKFAKKPIGKPAFKKKLKQAQLPPKAPKKLPPKKVSFKPAPLTAASVKKFADVRVATAGTAEIERHYKKNMGEFIGTAHSALTTLSYIRMRDEFKDRRKRARTPAARLKVDAQWKNVQKAAQMMNKAAGGASLTTAKLDAMAKSLTSNKVAYVEAQKMLASSQNTVTKTLTSNTSVTAQILPATLADVASRLDIINIFDNLCTQPITGSFTHHYSNSFSLVVRFTYWCPTWSNPLRTCTGSVTLAGVSFSVGIDVRYEIGCCGASITGSGYVNACGTIIGITACAGCRATVTAAASLGHSAVASGECAYGFSATASIVCQAAGITVLNVNHGFTFQVVGPCPPVPLPCASTVVI